MSTRSYYHPRSLEVDLADCPTWLYREIVSLHGHIRRQDPPVLSCLGNGDPMYIVHAGSGRYFARHYPGSNTDGHVHCISSMSAEHRREAEYSHRAAESAGLTAKLEQSTGNGTRLDVAVFGEVNVGLEIQRSGLSRANAKLRTLKSYSANWVTAWVTDQECDPDWADHVPTARLSVREAGNPFSHGVPPPNTARVIIGDFKRERDKNRPAGWRYVRQPKSVLLDELAVLMPTGDIVPVAVGKKGAVSLAFKESVDVIDSCTYPGAARWNPQPETPRQQEVVQRFTRTCHHPHPHPQVVLSPSIATYRHLWNEEAATECQVEIPEATSRDTYREPGPHGSVLHPHAWCWKCFEYGHANG